MAQSLTRRHFLGIGAGLAGAALLVACGAPPPPTAAPATQAPAAPTATSAPAAPSPTVAAAPKASTEPVQLRVFTFTTAEDSPLVFKYFRMFAEKNPNVTIKEEWAPYGTEYNDKFLMLAASGAAPDVAWHCVGWIQGIAQKGALKPLDDYIARDNFPIDDYGPQVKGHTYRGKIYGLPYVESSFAMGYNKDLFDKAGMKYPTGDWTWEDVRNAAFKLTVDKAGKTADQPGFNWEQTVQWGFAGYTPWEMAGWYSLLRNWGADLFNADRTQCVLDSPESISVFQFFADLTVKDHVAPTPVQEQIAPGGVFRDGLAAMSYTSRGAVNSIKQPGVKMKNWDVAPPPKGTVPPPKGAPLITYSGGCSYCIGSNSKGADTAWEFSKWMTSEEPTKDLALNGNTSTTRKSLFKYNVPADKIPANYQVAFLDFCAQYGVTPPYVPGFSEIQKIITKENEAVYLGKRTAQEAEKAVVPQVNDVLKRYGP